MEISLFGAAISPNSDISVPNGAEISLALHNDETFSNMFRYMIYLWENIDPIEESKLGDEGINGDWN